MRTEPVMGGGPPLGQLSVKSAENFEAVGPSLALPRAFANSAAYGDLVAATLALLSLASLPCGAGVVIAWIFNLWGSADLLNAFYQANDAGLMAGQLGATYFIPTLVVPLLLITHGLAFRILLRHQSESAMRESWQPGEVTGERTPSGGP
jgi:hypothetical protein